MAEIHGSLRSSRRAAVAVAIALVVLVLSHAAAQASSAAALERAEASLHQGDTAAAVAFLNARLERAPDDAAVRFASGVAQALAAVEGLAQDGHRYGVGGGSARETGLLFGLDVPANPAPEPIAYRDLRRLLDRFRERLVAADATLAPLADLAGTPAGAALALRLELGRIRLDFDGDGTAAEPLSAVLAELRAVAERGATTDPDRTIPVDLDLGDALWLRGYLNLLAGALDALLAYDAEASWDATAQLFFPRAITAAPYLAAPAAPDLQGFDAAMLADAVALIHSIDWPVGEPERLPRALGHVETTVALSRASWTAILAETDDRREWLPNPRQTGIIPSRPGGPPVVVTDAMIEEWFVLLDEVEAILAGRTLVPYWRVGDGRGVNVRRVFVEPRPFDLILWIQGAAVGPYLEEGPLSQGDTWRRITTAFGGRFLPFAVWFN